MSKFDINLLEQIEADKQLQIEELRKDLLKKCIETLPSYFNNLNVNNLYLTGSVLVEGKFSKRSDIDIAVSGLAPDKYFKAISELETVFERKVEIIELENCKFADKIKETGLKLI